jgi:hypothetical protein
MGMTGVVILDIYGTVNTVRSKEAVLELDTKSFERKWNSVFGIHVWFCFS